MTTWAHKHVDIKPWSVREINDLRRNAALGADTLAHLLGRTPNAIRLQAAKLRISLRRAGERRGRVLGQQPSTELPPGWRDLAVTDPATASTLAQDALTQAPLCPRCATWPQAPRLGICRVCHTHALAEAHRHAQALATAKRDLDQARQAKHRTLTES